MVARIYPSDNPTSGRLRKSSIYAAVRGDRDDGRGGSFNGSGSGRGHGGRGGRGRVGHVQGGCGGVVAHMKMELTSQMSPVTFKIQSRPHYQTIQGKGSLSTRYAQSLWQIKRGALPAL